MELSAKQSPPPLNDRIYSHRWNAAQLAQIEKVWEVLAQDFFQPMISSEDRVLDIGCGFCHFLNHIDAAEKVGVDANPDVKQYADAGIRLYQTADLSLPDLESNHFDFIFVSNFLEHLEGSRDVLNLLRRVRELLSERGQVVILQPNFRLLGWRYFDFIDHKTILTDKNLQEALDVCGFAIKRTILRFLPYTSKSRLPTHPLLVRCYLRFRPAQWLLGKQSLFIATGKVP